MFLPVHQVEISVLTHRLFNCKHVSFGCEDQPWQVPLCSLEVQQRVSWSDTNPIMQWKATKQIKSESCNLVGLFGYTRNLVAPNVLIGPTMTWGRSVTHVNNVWVFHCYNSLRYVTPCGLVDRKNPSEKCALFYSDNGESNFPET